MLGGSYRGNLNASVVNRTSAMTSADQSALLGAGSAGSPSPLRSSRTGAAGGGMGSPGGGGVAGGGASIDEAEARMKAREILQEFARERNKASEVEGQLDRAIHENERLQHQLGELRSETQLKIERYQREVNTLEKTKQEAEERYSTAKSEVKSVAAATAQRVADTTSHLRLKEQELQHLERELGSARDEIRQLRRELLAVKESATSSSELSKANDKVVELARKLLNSERAKSKLEEALLEDRRQYHQALTTIEGLHRDLSNAERKVEDAHNVKEGNAKSYQNSIELLHVEMERQRETYATFVQSLGLRGGGGGGAIAMAGGGSSAEQLAATAMEVAVQKAKLDALSRENARLKQEVAVAVEEAARNQQSLHTATTKRLEDISALQEKLRDANSKLEITSAELQRTRSHQHNQTTQYNDLKTLHEKQKSDFDAQVQAMAKLEVVLDSVTSDHEALQTQVKQVLEEAKQKEFVVEQLRDELQRRSSLEAKLREVALVHKHELELASVHAGGSFNGITDVDRSGSNAMRSPSAAGGGSRLRQLEDELSQARRELNDLQRERSRWEEDRQQMQRSREQENSTMLAENKALQRELENVRVENAQFRGQTISAQRETEEWRSAFYSSERAKAKVEAALADVQNSAAGASRDKTSLSSTLLMTNEHVQRLEHQCERDSQEVYRLRRQLAAQDIASARLEVEQSAKEIQRLETIGAERRGHPEGADEVAERERALIGLRMAKQRREQQLHEKELAASSLDESRRERLSSPTASPAPRDYQGSALSASPTQ